MWPLTRLIKYTVIGSASAATGGTVISLHGNQYQLDSIGIVRLGRAAFKVYDIASIYHTKLYKSPVENKASDEYRENKSECHKLGAEKLLELCRTNKGVYIKVGQHIGALDYLLPKEYVQTMKVLHSQAPTNSIEDVYKVIREEFKKEPSEMFKEFDPEPLGVASLAQVHRATLTDGRVVAVKVQHPYVRGNSLIDLKTMEILVKIVSKIFPEFKFQWLVDETKKNIPQELNFVQEGKNAEKIASLFSNYKWLRIPSIYWEYSTPRVLTMEFVEGGQVNDLEYIKKNRINPFEVSSKLGCLYSQMIFVEGFVHSDPHPGNILVHKSSSGNVDIVLLDHGLYAALSEEFRYEYSKLWLSILDRNKEEMKLRCNNLGIKGNMYGLFACMVTGRTWDSIMAGLDQTKHTKMERDVLQKEFPNLLPQISGVLEDVNRQMLLVLKTNDLMRGIESTLQTHQRMASFMVMSKFCVKSVYNEQLNKSEGNISRFYVILSEKWAIFKINLYYALRGLQSFSFFDTMRHIMLYS